MADQKPEEKTKEEDKEENDIALTVGFKGICNKCGKWKPRFQT